MSLGTHSFFSLLRNLANSKASSLINVSKHNTEISGIFNIFDGNAVQTIGAKKTWASSNQSDECGKSIGIGNVYHTRWSKTKSARYVYLLGVL